LLVGPVPPVGLSTIGNESIVAGTIDLDITPNLEAMMSDTCPVCPVPPVAPVNIFDHRDRYPYDTCTPVVDPPLPVRDEKYPVAPPAVTLAFK
jgi:hypothetical protein